ncbi:hypothetical protein BDZ91DRAFT_794290 [Kalaharituber pfeilii]|nr:hypothetical protein BDZ91DRAFT_794290 [Kalaharituber pfeilii]
MSETSDAPPSSPTKRVSSKLPIPRKQVLSVGSAPTLKQPASTDAAPKPTVRPPVGKPSTPTIAKRTSSSGVSNGVNTSSTGSRTATIRRASSKPGALPSTPEGKLPHASAGSESSTSNGPSKDPLKTVKDQRRASSVYLSSATIQKKNSNSQLSNPAVNRRASASHLPTLSSLNKQASTPALAKKTSASQLSTASAPLPRKASTTSLQPTTTVAKKTSAPQLNKRASTSTLSPPTSSSNASPSSARRLPSSGGLKSPTTPTTPAPARTPAKPATRQVSGSKPSAKPTAKPTVKPPVNPPAASTEEESPKKPKGNQSQSLRDAIAKARAAKAAQLKKGSVDTTGSGELEELNFDSMDPFNIGLGGSNEKVLQRKLQSARAEGKLNIANMELKDIPKQVYQMYEMKESNGKDDEPKWYESVDLVRLIAADNDIEEVGEELAKMFGGLVTIDMHNNMLHTLPSNLTTLMLTSLNLTNNKLGNDALELLCGITTLVDLKIAKNSIEGDLTPLIENLAKLEVLELQENKIAALPDSIEYLGHLRVLNLGNNNLTSIPFSKLKECSLAELNVSHNNLRGTLIEGVDELRTLELFDFRNNRISSLNDGALALPSLKTFLASANELSSIPDMDSWSELLTFIVDYNRLETIPHGLTSLPKLRVMDLTGNNFASLDPTIGTMEVLEVLKLEGNPLRERSLLGMPLADLKRTLKGRLAPPSLVTGGGVVEEESGEKEEVLELRPGGVLDLSKRDMDSISRDLLETVTPAPLSIEAHHNLLTTIPQAIEMFTASLTIVNLSHNKLSGDNYLPKRISLRWLTTLSVANNSITSIKPLLDNLDAPKLEQLDVAANRVKDIAGLRPTFPCLTRLYARENVIEEIPVETVDGMRVLDLAGNSIASLPPKLGLVTTLRELRVEGNCFRVPRWQVLEKGTESVLLWLRDRLPPDDTNTEDGFVSAMEE